MMQQINLDGSIHQEERKHNTKCEDAKPRGKCVCGCGGSMHGITHANIMEGGELERTINEQMGGEITEIINGLKGKTFVCSCKKQIKINRWLGYKHGGGLADKNGEKWWLYVECPKCEYCWSWHKVQVEVNRPRD